MQWLYQWAAQAVEGPLSRAVPLLATGAAAAGGARCTHVCMRVQAWLQLVVGYLLPTLFIDWARKERHVWYVPTPDGGVQALTLTQQARQGVRAHAGCCLCDGCAESPNNSLEGVLGTHERLSRLALCGLPCRLPAPCMPARRRGTAPSATWASLLWQRRSAGRRWGWR